MSPANPIVLEGRGHMTRRTSLFLAVTLTAALLAMPLIAEAAGGIIKIYTVSGTLQQPGTLTGHLYVQKINPNQAYDMVIAFEALPDNYGEPEHLYNGTYAFTFTNCQGGTATNTVETINNTRTDAFEKQPVYKNAPQYTATTGTPAHASMQCDYSVTFTGTPPPAPTTITAFQERVFLVKHGFLHTWSDYWPK